MYRLCLILHQKCSLELEFFSPNTANWPNQGSIVVTALSLHLELYRCVPPKSIPFNRQKMFKSVMQILDLGFNANMPACVFVRSSRIFPSSMSSF